MHATRRLCRGACGLSGAGSERENLGDLGDAEIAVLNTPALRCLAGVACGHLMACKVIADFCWNLAPARLVTLTWADNDVCDQSLKVLAITALSG
jgi:hypothetical protein